MRKAVDHLRKINSHPLIGFYTQEVRERGQRMGFDIVSVNGERAVLARKSESKLVCVDLKVIVVVFVTFFYFQFLRKLNYLNVSSSINT